MGYGSSGRGRCYVLTAPMGWRSPDPYQTRAQTAKKYNPASILTAPPPGWLQAGPAAHLDGISVTTLIKWAGAGEVECYQYKKHVDIFPQGR